MIFSQAGEIITDQANVMAPLLNDALEWFQNEMNNHGVQTFTKETFLYNVLPKATSDPGIQVIVSDTGYFDGVQNYALPQVPPDLLTPLVLWERQSNSQENWVPMRGPIKDGLPAISPGSRLGLWDWREDAICMVGATQSNDLRLRYSGTVLQFVTPQDILYFRGGCGPVAYYMVATYMMSKDADAAELAMKMAGQRVSQIATRNARTKQRVASVRRSYGSSAGTRFTPPRNF